MDGQHRQGFYNLYVMKRPKAADGLKDASGEDRDYYEMDIQDNVIRLSVKKVTYQTLERDPVYGIDLKFTKSNHPVIGGKWKIYLNDQLVIISSIRGTSFPSKTFLSLMKTVIGLFISTS